MLCSLNSGCLCVQSYSKTQAKCINTDEPVTSSESSSLSQSLEASRHPSFPSCRGRALIAVVVPGIKGKEAPSASLMAIKMRSIADIRAWQQAWVPKMGGWLSTAWVPWGSRQDGTEFKDLRAQGFFNLKLGPTLEELCQDAVDDEDDWTLCLGEDEDEDEDEDESLVQGQQLVNSGRYWAYDESKSTLENRRPELYQNMFG